MPHISPQDINAISDFESLLGFLHDKLDWPVGGTSKTIEDVSFDYRAEEELRINEVAGDDSNDSSWLAHFSTNLKFIEWTLALNAV